jgi:hypothetical protein
MKINEGRKSRDTVPLRQYRYQYRHYYCETKINQSYFLHPSAGKGLIVSIRCNDLVSFVSLSYNLISLFCSNLTQMKEYGV